MSFVMDGMLHSTATICCDNPDRGGTPFEKGRGEDTQVETHQQNVDVTRTGFKIHVLNQQNHFQHKIIFLVHQVVKVNHSKGSI